MFRFKRARQRADPIALFSPSTVKPSQPSLFGSDLFNLVFQPSLKYNFVCFPCFSVMLFVYLFIYSEAESCPGWSVVVQSLLTAASASWVQQFSHLSLQVAGTTGACHHAHLIFVFLVETGFHHVGQDGLDLLT